MPPLRRYIFSRIPVLWAGILFSCLGHVGHAASLELSLELFDEENWKASRLEARRVLIEEPHHALARYLESACAVRLGEEDKHTMASLIDLSKSTPPVMPMAAYELGQYFWSRNQPEQACTYLAIAFRQEEVYELFLRAGCSLDRLFRENPKLAAKHTALRTQLRACEPLWTDELRAICVPPRKEDKPGLMSLPGKLVVAIYRSQIAPAIGSRCSMHPSCSEFYRQASSSYGLLGVPMQADRFVRESMHVDHRMHPIMIDGKIKYYDPVSAHDFWMDNER